MGNRDLMAVTAVIEQEVLELMTNKVNATVYSETKTVLKDEGLDEARVARIAARITIRIKRALQEV